MTIKNIIKYNKSLQLIISKKLPIKVSFIIAKNKIKLEEILTIYNNKRMELINKYAEKDSQGEILIDNKGNAKINNMQLFMEELEELLSIKQEISLNYLTFSDLIKCDQDNFDSLTPQDIAEISWMIQEDGENDEDEE